jgi:hypothetical protein
VQGAGAEQARQLSQRIHDALLESVEIAGLLLDARSYIGSACSRPWRRCRDPDAAFRHRDGPRPPDRRRAVLLPRRPRPRARPPHRADGRPAPLRSITTSCACPASPSCT